MTRVPITKHGRDHRPEGSDPIPGLGCDCCPAWRDWSTFGEGGSFLIAANTTGCTPDISQPTGDLFGSVWTCDFDLLNSDTPPGMIQGSINIKITDPGSATAGDCASDFFCFYAILPPFVTEEIGEPFQRVPTGWGFTYQESTKTMIPAQLVWAETLGPGWGIMVAGTELSNNLGGTAADGWNMARPDYPFMYAENDTLFAGTFVFNPILVA